MIMVASSSVSVADSGRGGLGLDNIQEFSKYIQIASWCCLRGTQRLGNTRLVI